MNARRNSSKGSLPKALTLSDNVARLQASLSTPPPTGFQHSPMAHRAPKSALFAGFTGFGEAPITPMTPDMFKQQQRQQREQEMQDPLQKEASTFIEPARKMSQEEAVEASAITSAPSTPPPGSPSGTLSSSARSTKRSFDSATDATPPDMDLPSKDVKSVTFAPDEAGQRFKRQMRARSAEAASETTAVLTPAHESLGELAAMPVTYLRRHFLGVARHMLNEKRGASCYIKAVPFGQDSQVGRICARVASHNQPGRTRELHFDFTQADEAGSDDGSCKSANSHEGDGEEHVRQRRSSLTPRASTQRPHHARREPNSAIFPLHAEVALMRAPLLGRLLLSGLVVKGDLLDLEFPHPQLFGQVMRWMYTGQTADMQKGEAAANQRRQFNECVAYLWGRY